MMKSLITRTTSAFLAISLLITLYYWLGLDGLKVIIYFSIAVGAFELTNILLPRETSTLHKALFFITSLLVFHTSTHYPAVGMLGITIFIVFFLIVGVLTNQNFSSIDGLLNYQTKALLGFVYIGLLPSYAYKLLDLPNGLNWFCLLLATVFAGDIGAYLVGVLFGKHKMMPLLSPNKTWEGAIGGLLSSLFIGYLASRALPHVPIMGLLATTLITGVVAQAGDFFESLLKRVSGVKDSGRIMPGHGGALDRIDGVLFASPIIMMAASLFEALQ